MSKYIPKKSFAHNKIEWEPTYKVREHATRQYKGPVNANIEYLSPTKVKFASATQLLQAVRVAGVVYRQIPEFPEYYISAEARILSMNTSTVKLLTPQYIKRKDGKLFGPVARIRSIDDKYYTRSAGKLVREIWYDTKNY